jgi:two-component system KDP operon response regulator KdpE
MLDDGFRNRMVLVVDDEERMVRFIRLNLEHDGFQVIESSTGMVAVNLIREKLPDIVLLDVMLPDIDGYEVLKLIRQHHTTPVIMLTARGEEEDRVKGLELGADDYITKPFSPRELVSRIKAVLRRSESSGMGQKEIIKVDNHLTMDFGRHEILIEGQPIQLRPTEYRLLYHLVMNAGWVQTYDTLLAKVWGYEYQDEPHYVRLYVNYLRQKLEKDPANPIYILTERGVGYRFVDYRKIKTDPNSQEFK